MDMPPDINRRLESMLRQGTVAEVDYSRPAAPRVRVQSGGLLSDWLPIPGSAGAVKIWNPPSVGEQVLIASPSGEFGAGYLVASFSSDDNQAPSTSPDEVMISFPDGATIRYDHAAGGLTASGVKTAHITASESAEIEAPTVTITGDAEVSGDVKITGNLEVTGTLKVSSTSEFTGLATFSGGTEGDRT